MGIPPSSLGARLVSGHHSGQHPAFTTTSMAYVVYCTLDSRSHISTRQHTAYEHWTRRAGVRRATRVRCSAQRAGLAWMEMEAGSRGGDVVCSMEWDLSHSYRPRKGGNAPHPCSHSWWCIFGRSSAGRPLSGRLAHLVHHTGKAARASRCSRSSLALQKQRGPRMAPVTMLDMMMMRTMLLLCSLVAVVRRPSWPPRPRSCSHRCTSPAQRCCCPC